MWVGIGVGIGRNRFATGIFSAYEARVIADGGITEAGQCVDAVTGLLLNASLLLIPSGYKANKLYAEIPTNGNGDLTWTRTSTAIRTNSSSLLESMATGVPRLSYMYGSCPSVLLEPQRTNLLLYSQQFDDAYWTKTASSVSQNTTTSPDNTNNADTYLQDASGFPRLTSPSFTFNANTDYTLSVYIKNIDAVRFSIVMLSDLSTTSWFNLQTYTLESVSGSMSEARITNIGNGWYRVTTKIRYTTNTSSAFYFRLSTSSSVNSVDFSKSIYLYGAQLEAGAYPTTYIPTTSATATRVADSFSRSNIYTNGLISASGGTWFVELRNNILYTRDNTSGVFVGDSTSANSGNQIIVRNAGGLARLSVFKYVSGTATNLYTTTTDTTKIAVKWNGSTADVFANGTKVVSATSFTTTIMENFLGSGGVPYFIQQMALFPTPLSDTDCTTLTT